MPFQRCNSVQPQRFCTSKLLERSSIILISIREKSKFAPTAVALSFVDLRSRFLKNKWLRKRFEGSTALRRSKTSLRLSERSFDLAHTENRTPRTEKRKPQKNGTECISAVFFLVASTIVRPNQSFRLFRPALEARWQRVFDELVEAFGTWDDDADFVAIKLRFQSFSDRFHHGARFFVGCSRWIHAHLCEHQH